MKVNKRKRLHMSKRTGAIVALCVVMVITLCLGYLGLNGMWLDNRGLYKLLPWLPTTNAERWPASITLGLDVKGGVFVEYAADMSEEMKAEGHNFDTLLNSTILMIPSRLAENGYPDATATKLGAAGIRVEIPNADDPAVAQDLVGTPAALEFLDPEGNVFMENRHLEAAYATQDAGGKYAIALILTKQGTEIFADMTEKSVGQTISITLDGETLMSPTVNGKIDGGSVLISGDFTLQQAQTIAQRLQSGALQLDLRKAGVVSAEEGAAALSASVKAALIGLLIVIVILVVLYRLSGLMAAWALVLSVILVFLLIAALPGIQFTLLGMVGVILGVGVSAVASMIIFERVKDEVQEGRPMAHAVRLGFENAKSAVVNVYIATLIAVVVLLFVSAGPVQGFAATLLLSVLASMFCAIVVTRFLLTRAVRIVNAPALFMAGASIQKNPETAQGEAN